MFCVQAEDGIRDLVRSRGLGDVYKRQSLIEQLTELQRQYCAKADAQDLRGIHEANDAFHAVSYTHLTLPTSDLV